MHKLILVLLASMLLLNVGITAVLADGMILPEAISPDYLVVRYHHVTVTINDNHAVTRVEQEFINPHDVPVSGQYLFPIPPDAIFSGFEAEVEGRRQTVIRQDATTTNAALYAIVAERHDPSLLRYADWESVTFDLDLPAGAKRKMTLEYEQVLLPAGGMLHYHYILSTERYSSLPVEEVSVTVDVTSSTGLGSLYSSSHEVSMEHLDTEHARVTWQAEYVNPTEDFDLFFSPAEGGFGGGFLTGKREDSQHFLFLFAPENGKNLQENAFPKDIMFVIDRSGSMSGEKIAQAHKALQFILDQLNPQDRFSIVGFDHRIRVFSDTLLPVTRHSLADARQFVKELTADGDTNLEAALQTGLNVIEESETRADAAQLVIFLTDGLPTEGITDEDLIAELVTRTNQNIAARFHVFGVGYDVNTHLLDRLAVDNGGSVTYVLPDESLEMALSNFYQKIAAPVLTDLHIAFEGIEVHDIYPASLPDMFRGSSLLLAGQYTPTGERSQVVVRVTGVAGTEAREYVYTFDLAETRDYDFVPRLWATRHIGALLDDVRVSGETASLVEEIRDLGLTYGIVTPYTTFVIAAQADGAASVENMSLYSNRSDLNASSGRTTVEARVQNQMYQDTAQASLANGANVVQSGERSLAQIHYRNVDLNLLRDQKAMDEPLSDAWITENIRADRQVQFGSDSYFALAADPEARTFLQSGSSVIFNYQGEVIEIQDPEAEERYEEAAQTWENEVLQTQNSITNQRNGLDPLSNVTTQQIPANTQRKTNIVVKVIVWAIQTLRTFIPR